MNKKKTDGDNWLWDAVARAGGLPKTDQTGDLAEEVRSVVRAAFDRKPKRKAEGSELSDDVRSWRAFWGFGGEQ